MKIILQNKKLSLIWFVLLLFIPKVINAQFTPINNGSFENPPIPIGTFERNPPSSTWNYTPTFTGIASNGSAYTNGNGNAPDGNQVLFLQSASNVSTSFNLSQGSQVSIAMEVAQRNRGSYYDDQELKVKIFNGTTTETIGTFNPETTNYEQITTVPIFLGAGSNYQLILEGTKMGDNTMLIDDVQIEVLVDTSINNGSFENPPIPIGTFRRNPPSSTWNYTPTFTGIASNGSAYTNGNGNAPDGNQVLFLQSASNVSTSFNLTQGGQVSITMEVAQRNRGSYYDDQELKVKIFNGTTIETIGTFNPESINYEQITTVPIFLGAGSNYQLILEGTRQGDNTMLIDDVQIVLDDTSNLVTAIFSGPWSESSTWSTNLVPSTDDNVVIPQNIDVTLNTNADIKSLKIEGKLTALRGTDLNLSANYILVDGPNAILDWGTVGSRYNNKATITLKGNNEGYSHSGMGRKFLGARMGGRIYMHGDSNKRSWTSLAQTLERQSNEIIVQNTTNWNIGDEIVITSTDKEHTHAEKFTIENISGNTITLNRNATYKHLGITQNYNVAPGDNRLVNIRAEVGLLSHNITIQGDPSSSETQFGGHIMIHTNGYAYFDSVELYNMGQKAILGRYPFHWHMLGNIGSGQYFRNSSVHQSYNRAITIHGTESTLVYNNFFYDHIGHGVFLENGSERFNIIRNNVTLLTKRPSPGEELTPSETINTVPQNISPASYWITNPNNTFEDNVAAGTEGTGFWFAFPLKPLGESATDPRFMNLEPYKEKLGSFKRNISHSSSNGFDVFDQLDSLHGIIRNGAWKNSQQHIIEDCLWYANDLAIYTGLGKGGAGGSGPTDNLIFRNNIFIENRVSIMLASSSIVDNSLIVGETIDDIYQSYNKYAYRVYDGPGQVKNSHFFNYNTNGSKLFWYLGAATKHPNHLFENNSFNETPNFGFPNFDLPPKAGTMEVHDEHPRVWSTVIKDVDGTLTGYANRSVIGNHPFQRNDDDIQLPNSPYTYASNKKFALSVLRYDVPFFSLIPNIVATRSKSGLNDAHVYYINGYKEPHQLPIIVNDGFEYIYRFETLPNNIKAIKIFMEDATKDDTYVVRFKQFGELENLGLQLRSDKLVLIKHGSLDDLYNNTESSGYFIEPSGDLIIRIVAVNSKQNIIINWDENFTPLPIDTDGDGVTDGQEIIEGTHPFVYNGINNITESSINNLSEAAVIVHPNPFDDHIKFSLNKKGEYKTMKLLDLNGNQIDDMKISPENLDIEWRLDYLNLEKGLYILELLGPKQNLKIKLLNN